jgi:type II secretory pathway component PulF
MTRSPMPIDYKSPSASPGREAFSLPAFIAASFPAVTLLIVCLFVTPKFKAVLADFGVDLPIYSRLCLAVSDWVALGWGWIFLLLTPPLLAFLWPLLTDRREPAESRVVRWLVVWLIAGLGSTLIVLIAAILLFVPMLGLFTSVSGK